jgi:hypothetical protein
MKKSAPKKRVPRTAESPEQRHHLINDAAVFHVPGRSQAGGDDVEDLAESYYDVQAAIDAVLKYQDAA